MMATPLPHRGGQAAIVLVVEDEKLQRISLVEMLNETDYDTVEAADADQAIAILVERPDIPTVVVDVDMPGRRERWRCRASFRTSVR